MYKTERTKHLFITFGTNWLKYTAFYVIKIP